MEKKIANSLMTNKEIFVISQGAVSLNLKKSFLKYLKAPCNPMGVLSLCVLMISH